MLAVLEGHETRLSMRLGKILSPKLQNYGCVHELLQ